MLIQFLVQFSALVGAMIKQGKELGMNVVWLSHYGAETNVLITDYKSVSDGLIYPYIYDTENKTHKHNHLLKNIKQNTMNILTVQQQTLMINNGS